MPGKLKPTNRYDDIIHLPHHVSPTRPRMGMIDRAAQFSPFAALTGYDAAIRETGRLTESRIELDENRKIVLDRRLCLIRDHIHEHPEITVTYFKPDGKKAGGAYISVTGRVKKLDSYERLLLLEDKISIPIEEIYGMDGALFKILEAE